MPFFPGVSAVTNLPVGSAQVNAGLGTSIGTHSLPQDAGEAIIRQAIAQRLPGITPVPTAADSEPAIGGVAVFVALLGDNEHCVSVIGIESDGEAKLLFLQPIFDALPVIAAIITAVDSLVVLLKQTIAVKWIQSERMHARTNTWMFFRWDRYWKSLVAELPGLATIV